VVFADRSEDEFLARRPRNEYRSLSLTGEDTSQRSARPKLAAVGLRKAL